MRGHSDITFTSQNHSSFVTIRTRGTLSHMSSYCHPPTTLSRFVFKVASSISASQFSSYIDKSQENINTALAPRTDAMKYPTQPIHPMPGCSETESRGSFTKFKCMNCTKTMTCTGRRRTMWRDGGYQVQMYELQ